MQFTKTPSTFTRFLKPQNSVLELCSKNYDSLISIIFYRVHTAQMINAGIFTYYA